MSSLGLPAAIALLGLDANHQVVFEFSHVNNTGCRTSWNALPVPQDDMQFQ